MVKYPLSNQLHDISDGYIVLIPILLTYAYITPLTYVILSCFNIQYRLMYCMRRMVKFCKALAYSLMFVVKGVELQETVTKTNDTKTINKVFFQHINLLAPDFFLF